MTHTAHPEDERRLEAKPEASAKLHLSLLLRERKAWVAAEPLQLGPGVRLLTFEALLPSVAFPITMPLRVRDHRHERLEIGRLGLEFELPALSRALTEVLQGAALGPLEITDVQLEPLAPSTNALILGLEARSHGGERASVVLFLELAQRVDGGTLRCTPRAAWRFGPLATCDALLDGWMPLVSSRVPGITLEGDALALHLVHLAVRGAFARAGWKVPRLPPETAIELRPSDRTWRLEVNGGSSRDDLAPAPWTELADVEALLHEVSKNARIDPYAALEALDALEPRIVAYPQAAHALLRLRFALARRSDLARAIAAARRLRELAPEPGPNRALWLGVVWRSGGHEAVLEELSALASTAVASPVRRARTALARCLLALERGDLRAAHLELDPAFTDDLETIPAPLVSRMFAARAVLASLEGDDEGHTAALAKARSFARTSTEYAELDLQEARHLGRRNAPGLAAAAWERALTTIDVDLRALVEPDLVPPTADATPPETPSADPPPLSDPTAVPWQDLASRYEDALVREDGKARALLLRELAEVRSEHLADDQGAEDALRLALEDVEPGEDAFAETLRRRLAEGLENTGRYADLAAFLESELSRTPALDPLAPASTSRTVELTVSLARLYRTHLADEASAARAYERLETIGHLPEDGVLALSEWYRKTERYEDLLRVLRARAGIVARRGDVHALATLHRQAAETLEGPLSRPADAAHHLLEAWLATGLTHPEEGARDAQRARTLFLSRSSVAAARPLLQAVLEKETGPRLAAALCFFGELLATDEDFESEAEEHLRHALELSEGAAYVQSALGRLMARQGRLELAVTALRRAVCDERLPTLRLADDAAVLARSLVTLDRHDEARSVLERALVRDPTSQRILLELGRVYQKTGNAGDELRTLEQLAALPLVAMLRADVDYRRALLRLRVHDDALSSDPSAQAGSASKDALKLLLAAVVADAHHVAARQALLELATREREWSTVAHMHFLAIRELESGVERAVVHLELARTYEDHLLDEESAIRNLETGLSQGAGDRVVFETALELSTSFRDPRSVAERLERSLGHAHRDDPTGRASVDVVIARLYELSGDFALAGKIAGRALEQTSARSDVLFAASRFLERQENPEADGLRQQQSGLLRLLRDESEAVERLTILARLTDIAQTIGDVALERRCLGERLDLTRTLVGDPHHREAAAIGLRDLLEEDLEPHDLLQLCVDFAAQLDDVVAAVLVLRDAARMTQRRLVEPVTTLSILRTLLERAPTLDLAVETFTEGIRSIDNATLETADLGFLQAIGESHRDGRIHVLVAEIAERLGRYDEAVAALSRVFGEQAGPSLRLRAFVRLEALLARTGREDERLPILAAHYKEARLHDPARAADLGRDLGTAYLAAEDFERALATTHEALAVHPNHVGLLQLRSQLFEHNEQWDAMARDLERLGDLALAADERAMFLARAAACRLAHGRSRRANADDLALTLLRRALSIAPHHGPTLETMVPLLFERAAFGDILPFVPALLSVFGDAHAILTYAALAEPLANGTLHVSERLRGPVEPTVLRGQVWPALRRALLHLATEGPLPRLDPLLAAASRLAGNGRRLVDELSAFASGQPLHPGLALGLARLHEAEGQADLARNLYQLASFMASTPALSDVVTRLPEVTIPSSPLSSPGFTPLEARSPLSYLLYMARSLTTGLRTDDRALPAPSGPEARALLVRSGKIATTWRSCLALPLPVRCDPAARDFVTVRNDPEPTIVVSPTCVGLSEAELRFRLARASATIALGHAILFDDHPVELVEFADAILQVLDAHRRPLRPASLILANELVMRGLRPGVVTPELVGSLERELARLIDDPAAQARQRDHFQRASLLVATRLSGRLDGALEALCRDAGLDPSTPEGIERTLALSDVHWLLRHVQLHAG